jgi:hypothetical protein
VAKRDLEDFIIVSCSRVNDGLFCNRKAHEVTNLESNVMPRHPRKIKSWVKVKQDKICQEPDDPWNSIIRECRPVFKLTKAHDVEK